MKAAAQATEEENIKENENRVPVFPGTNLIHTEKQFPTRPDPRGHRPRRDNPVLCSQRAWLSPRLYCSWRRGAHHLGDPPAKAREAHGKSHVRNGTFESGHSHDSFRSLLFEIHICTPCIQQTSHRVTFPLLQGADSCTEISKSGLQMKRGDHGGPHQSPDSRTLLSMTNLGD